MNEQHEETMANYKKLLRCFKALTEIQRRRLAENAKRGKVLCGAEARCFTKGGVG